MTTISLSDRDLATIIAALRVVAADAQTQGAAGVASECEALAMRLTKTGEAADCAHEVRWSVTLGNYCVSCKKTFNNSEPLSIK